MFHLKNDVFCLNTWNAREHAHQNQRSGDDAAQVEQALQWKVHLGPTPVVCSKVDVKSSGCHDILQARVLVTPYRAANTQ